MSYNAAGSMVRGVEARSGGAKIMTTMKDFIILTKIGKHRDRAAASQLSINSLTHRLELGYINVSHLLTHYVKLIYYCCRRWSVLRGLQGQEEQ